MKMLSTVLQGMACATISAGMHLIAHSDSLSKVYAENPIGFVVSLIAGWAICAAMFTCVIVVSKIVLERD